MQQRVPKVRVEIEVQIHPTEDIRKIRQAVENLFGNLPLENSQRPEDDMLTIKTDDVDALSRFGDMLRRERIRDAARAVLLQGLKGNTFTFFLNKQVAYSSHVSFCEPSAESPLGPIKVQIRCDDPKKLVDWLAPKTARRS